MYHPPRPGSSSTKSPLRADGSRELGREPAGPMSINKDLVAATSTPLVLAILAEGDSYGYAILKRVRELSGGELEWTDGMLYPVLHRLERSGLVESRWEKTESGRRRKYYRVTEAGREQLADERRQWRTMDETLRKVWSALADSASGDGSPVPLLQRS
jgi:PadR family transcriptional regulator, regulatory protein PadR